MIVGRVSGQAVGVAGSGSEDADVDTPLIVRFLSREIREGMAATRNVCGCLQLGVGCYYPSNGWEEGTHLRYLLGSLSLLPSCHPHGPGFAPLSVDPKVTYSDRPDVK